MLFEAPPDMECRISVILPVRDEAERLLSALQCLANQVNLHGSAFDPRQYEILVLANNCSDHSADLCRVFALQHPGLALHVAEVALPTAQATVGHARRMLAEEASVRLHAVGGSTRVIASTDGDTRVAPGWLAATLAAVAQGADAVAGRISLDATERQNLQAPARRALRQSVAYGHALAEFESHLDPVVWDPWPRHGQHFGASFAVTAAAYCRAGGMPIVAENEDIGLYDALLRVDARVRHSPGVRVWTSGRLNGRVSTGLAAQLGTWSRMTQPEVVESPEATSRRLSLRRAARNCWRNRFSEAKSHFERVASLATELSVAPSWLLAQFGQAPFFGAVWDSLSPCWSSASLAGRRVPIGEAIVELRRRCQGVFRASAR